MAAPDQALFPAAGMLAPWREAHREITGEDPHRAGDGLFPLTRKGGVLRTWKTPLFFAGVPLVGTSEALSALLKDIAHLRQIPASGPFWDMLQAEAARTGADIHVLRRWERAALEVSGSFEAWFEKSYDRKRRKEYRRLKARLGETGRLESIALEPGADPSQWTDDILALEARGWKGKRGTAMAGNPKVAAALKTALNQLARDHALRFWKLALDGKPIAMMFALVHQGQAWLGKIAYDEAYAKYSPGVLLVLDATENIFAEGTIRLVDSCAIPGHPMIDHVWRDRLAMADVMAGPRGVRLGALVALERLKLTAREALRDLYYTIRRRRRS